MTVNLPPSAAHLHSPKCPPEELQSVGKRHYNRGEHKLAVQCFRKAAEQGNLDAQYRLGICYHNGHGVQKDYGQAVYWYRKAAEQGYAEAQFKLGFCNEDGQGTQQNYKQALLWYKKAAKQGHEFAIEALERLRLQGKLRRWPWF